jgi:hypothetical protein
MNAAGKIAFKRLICIYLKQISAFTILLDEFKKIKQFT